jgi:hypothetical protein
MIKSSLSGSTSPVAPRAGAWIEIDEDEALELAIKVAPRAGAWIEIHHACRLVKAVTGRSPCGSVD